MIPGRIKRITAPSVEPVTLAEALVQCHASAGAEDAWFNERIKGGREAAEDYQHRAYISQVWELTLDRFPALPLHFPRSPVISIDSIKYTDIENVENTFSSTNYYYDLNSEPALLDLKYGMVWPTTNLRNSSAVKIQFTAGYGTSAATVPVSVKSAILLYVNHLYENRAGEIPELPRAFYDLLRPNRLYL